MHSNDSAYVHTKFAHQDSIRLLELLPGLRGSPLKSNIIIARKGNNPVYEALSYAWGDPTPLHPIQEISSGTVLRIATSLEQALQAIRDTHAPRVLWIDAICINQSNTQEKGHQVALMGQLYHDARRVIVWLPCKGCRPTRVECVLKDFINAHIADEEFSPFTNPDQVIDIKTILTRIPMMKIFDEPWFQRVWVVREFLFAREVQIVTSHDLIDIELLRTAIRALDHFMEHHCGIFFRNGKYSAENYRQLRQLHETIRLMSQLFRYQQMRLSSTGQRATTELGASGASLASCAVDLPRGRQCMDPRDRVYAMLALTDKGTRITPNYNLPFRSVLLGFTMQSLLGGELFLLHASGICPSHDGTLPSFVPNIEDSAGMPLPVDSHEFKFSRRSSSLCLSNSRQQTRSRLEVSKLVD